MCGQMNGQTNPIVFGYYSMTYVSSVSVRKRHCHYDRFVNRVTIVLSLFLSLLNKSNLVLTM